ncbi:uncharacterized protein LOC135703350 [Ochlerotatus camptorhynchus]|uniref:uncharacterized protein LOC135703350 n=1 Tax=Ochlerotatus camptorhynchus TaxID=644619 RepID=UPI0031DFEA0A
MDQKLYESENKSGGNGDEFQIDIALALSLRMRELSSTTRMAYGMKMADKFDDVVLIDDTNKEMHLIQAKHGDTKFEKVKIVDLDALFPTETRAKHCGDFSLFKYAKSYFIVNGRLELREYKKMFYIFTNKDLKQTDNEWVKFEEREVNEILRFSGFSARNLKLIPTEKAIDEVRNYINKDIIAIKDAIKEFFHSGTISLKFIHYCTPLKEVMTIDQKKCRFASDFNAEHTNPNVAMLYTLLQCDQVDMKKKVTVNNNFLAKDSRNKLLPPFVGEDDIRDFFRDFILSVGQPNDLRPIIVGELLAWMKTWIQPDILGQLGEKDLEQQYTAEARHTASRDKARLSTPQFCVKRPGLRGKPEGNKPFRQSGHFAISATCKTSTPQRRLQRQFISARFQYQLRDYPSTGNFRSIIAKSRISGDSHNTAANQPVSALLTNSSGSYFGAVSKPNN